MKYTGSLQIKKGKYYTVIRIPNENGKSTQKWEATGISAGGNTKKERQAAEREAGKLLALRIEELEKAQTYAAEGAFVQWIKDWLERKQSDVRTSTWEGYKIYVDTHVVPYFEALNLKIADVTPRVLQKYVDTKHKEGQSASSLTKHMVILRGVFDDAMRFNVLAYNPCDRVKLPKMKKHQGKAYTAEQATLLLNVIKDEPIRAAIVLGLFLGLRRSEALGLRWQDIDFAKDEIRIRNTVVKILTTVEAEQTKSAASCRNLWMSPELKKFLLELKAEQEEMKAILGSAYEDTGHVCCWKDGRAFEPDYITHRFPKILKKNKLPIITFHELRHSCGSILLNAGVSPKAIQEYLGHEDIKTTMNIYTHLTAENKKSAANTLGNLLSTPA